MVWCVVITKYEDNSDNMYDDSGISCCNPVLFKTRESAEKHICLMVGGAIQDRLAIMETKFEDIEPIYQHYLINVEPVKIKPDYYYNYIVIDMLHDKFCKGYYVDYSITWDLHDLTIFD